MVQVPKNLVIKNGIKIFSQQSAPQSGNEVVQLKTCQCGEGEHSEVSKLMPKKFYEIDSW